MARSLLEEDFCHHPLVLVIQQMTMKYRHASYDGVSKVQDDIDSAGVGDIHGVEPRRIGEWNAILCVSQEVHLVNVERM